MKRFLFSLLVIVSWRAAACSCAVQSLPEAYAAAEAVFTAKVTSVERDRTGLWNHARLEPLHTYKGTAENSVRTASSGASCGYGFQAGETYLIWASRSDAGLATSLCSQTKPLKLADEAVRWLQSQGH